MSPEALSHIWEEAEGLFSSPNVACDAPDMVDAKCMANGSGDKPHIVTKSKKDEISCEENLCSHACSSRKYHLLEDLIRKFAKSKHHSQCSERC